MTVTLTINNRSLTVSDGSSLLEVVNASGTHVPQAMHGLVHESQPDL